jgi:hypothetical protein
VLGRRRAQARRAAAGTHIDPYDIPLPRADTPTRFFVGEFRTRSVVRCRRASFLEVRFLLSQLVGRAEAPVGVSSLRRSD